MLARRGCWFTLIMAGILAVTVFADPAGTTRPVVAGAASGAAAAHGDPAQGPNASTERMFGGAAAPPLTPDPAFSPGSSPGSATGHVAAAGSVAPRGVAAAAARPTSEVFGFAPYWELPNWQQWRLNLLTTISYFGITYDAAGNPAGDAGMTGYNSQQLSDLVNAAHGQGVRALLTVKAFNDTDIWSICSNPQNTQTAVIQAVSLAKQRGFDGVTVDFEGATSPSYPGLPQCFTNFMGSMYSSVHQQMPGSEVVVATYSGAASWNDGFMNISALAPNTDAFFVMAYDMFLSGLASPNAPLNGPSYNDTASVQQYIAKASASKVILGVPYYGYKWTVASPGVSVPGTMVSGHNVDTYGATAGDLAGQGGLSYHWDATAASPFAQWATADSSLCVLGPPPCWRELYYENPASLSAKYELAKSNGIRGVGIWALGYDSGSGDLWNVLAAEFFPWMPAARLAVAGLTNREVYTALAPGGYADTGGRALAAPAVVMQNGVATTIVTGDDHRLWVRSDAAPGWALLAPTSYCLDNPAASLVGPTLFVSCVGGDHALWTASGPMVSGPGLPTVGGWTSLGGFASAGPAMTPVVSGGSNLEYWVSGGDGFVWTRTAATGWSSTTWRVFGHMGAATAGRTAWVAMTGVDNKIYYGTNTGSGWSLFVAGGVAVGGVGIAAYPDSTARFFCEALDSSIYSGVVTSSGGAPGWEHDGGAVAFGAGAAG